MLFFVWLLSIGFSITLAGAKNRSAFNWAVCSFLFGPLGLLLLMAMPVRTLREQALGRGDMRSFRLHQGR